MAALRADGRGAEALRPIRFTRKFTSTPAGSCLSCCGRTMVLCTASVVPGVPEWMAGKGRGWITAEYTMLPGATAQRKPRDTARGRIDGRTVEIQRLVGRAVRAIVDLRNLGENTVWLDCDVLEADGGTRTTAVNGAYIALVDACRWMERRGMLFAWPLRSPLSAVSVGIVQGQPLVDLTYAEDSQAEVDMNVVMTEPDQFVEVQGTGEKRPYTGAELSAMLALAARSTSEIRALQEAALAE